MLLPNLSRLSLTPTPVLRHDPVPIGMDPEWVRVYGHEHLKQMKEREKTFRIGLVQEWVSPQSDDTMTRINLIVALYQTTHNRGYNPVTISGTISLMSVHIAVALFDRIMFLTKDSTNPEVSILRSHFELLIFTCLFLAIKWDGGRTNLDELLNVFNFNAFAEHTNLYIDRIQIVPFVEYDSDSDAESVAEHEAEGSEALLLRTIDQIEFNAPTALQFASIFMLSADFASLQTINNGEWLDIKNMVSYLLTYALSSFPMREFLPSEMAAACLRIATQSMGVHYMAPIMEARLEDGTLYRVRCPVLEGILHEVTGYTDAELEKCYQAFRAILASRDDPAHTVHTFQMELHNTWPKAASASLADVWAVLLGDSGGCHHTPQ
jgi:hypothetical protein